MSPSNARKVASLWWCATCRLQVVVPGAPRRCQCGYCRHWMTWRRLLGPPPQP
jgi:hypothetical protein